MVLNQFTYSFACKNLPLTSFTIWIIERETLFHRGGSRTAATSKMKHFVIMVNGFQPLTIITKISILEVAAVLDPPLN